MKIDDLKPIATFSEYTIRPIMEEFHFVLDEFDKRGIPFNEKFLKKIISMYVYYLVSQFIQNIIITVLICLAAIKIL